MRKLTFGLLVALACTAPPAADPFVQPDGTDSGEPPFDAGATTDAGSPDAGFVCTGRTLGAGTYDWTLTHENRTRSFQVYVPQRYSQGRGAALVFNFHGLNASADEQAQMSGMKAVAEAHGFIVVHANGLTGQEMGISPDVSRSWNAGACCGAAMTGGSDDVGFVRKMLAVVEQQFCVDPKRVFATGFSNGAFLTHRLACEMSGSIAAIGPVAGVNGMDSCPTTRPVPVLHFHGTKDPYVPYDGTVAFRSAQESIDGWAARNGCVGAPTVSQVTADVSCQRFAGCDGGADTTLCTVADGGHAWPGGQPLPEALFGVTTQSIDASEEIARFFEAHPLR